MLAQEKFSYANHQRTPLLVAFVVLRQIQDQTRSPTLYRHDINNLEAEESLQYRTISYKQLTLLQPCDFQYPPASDIPLSTGY